MWINTIIIYLLLMIVHQSSQHGKMIVPPARNCAWRYGFKTPINYNDNELFCGGLTTMFMKNHGKCGICGDSYSDSQPRKYETGGKDYTGIITKKYTAGQKIIVEILITANHFGTFKFSICPRNDPLVKETESCFIDVAKFTLQTHNTGTFKIPIKLPKNIVCSHCVLRWHWRGANNWGICPDGKGRVGCGPQETFRNCADIAIKGNSKSQPKINIHNDDDDDDHDPEDPDDPDEEENSIDDDYSDHSTKKAMNHKDNKKRKKEIQPKTETTTETITSTTESEPETTTECDDDNDDDDYNEIDEDDMESDFDKIFKN